MINNRKRRVPHGFIKNFSVETQEKIIFHLNNPSKVLLVLIALSIFCFFHSLFSYYTLFSFSLAILASFLLIKNCVEEIHKNGLINFLPKRLQTFLLNRSIFDVLCDLWFIPKIGLYIKAFAGPFYYEYTPEKALTNFEVIGLTRAVTVKGFLNLFPGLKKVLLPPNRPKSPIKRLGIKADDINNKDEIDSDDSSSSVSSLPPEEEKKGDTDMKADYSSNPNFPMKNPEENANKSLDENIQINSNYNTFVNIQSTVIFRSDAFKSQNIPLIIRDDQKKPMEGTIPLKTNKKSKRSPQFINGIISNKQPKNFFYDDIFEKDNNHQILEKTTEFQNLKDSNINKKPPNFKSNKFPSFPIINDDLPIDIPKTKVISSCKKSEKEALDKIKRASIILDEDVLVSNAWDNIKKFELKKLEEKKKIDNGEVEEEEQVRGVFNIVQLMNEIKKNGILSKINNQVLMKLLGVSAIGLLLQLKYNKKARAWIINSLMYMGFSGIFLLFGSSLALLIVKSLKNQKKGRKALKDDENDKKINL